MKKPTKDQIYTALFRKIANGDIKENTRLKEEELAEEFGVSRSPIREALQLLAQDGLVELLPNRGARAQTLTPDDIEEIYEIRKRLELLALEHAVPRIRLEVLREFKRKIQAIPDDVRKASEVDGDFHTYLVGMSNKKRLIDIIHQLIRPIMNFWYFDFNDSTIPQRTRDEHLSLIEALTLRDTEKAKRILGEHLDNSKKATLDFLFTHH